MKCLIATSLHIQQFACDFRDSFFVKMLIVRYLEKEFEIV